MPSSWDLFPGPRAAKRRTIRRACDVLRIPRFDTLGPGDKPQDDGGVDLMLTELGQFALALALPVALIQALVPLIGAARNTPAWMAVARPAAFAQLGLIGL